jgi:hypothetical protein
LRWCRTPSATAVSRPSTIFLRLCARPRPHPLIAAAHHAPLALLVSLPPAAHLAMAPSPLYSRLAATLVLLLLYLPASSSVCPAGSFSDQLSCTSCPTDTFQARSNSSACTPCGAYHQCVPDPSAPAACGRLGKTSMTECELELEAKKVISLIIMTTIKIVSSPAAYVAHSSITDHRAGIQDPRNLSAPAATAIFFFYLLFAGWELVQVPITGLQLASSGATSPDTFTLYLLWVVFIWTRACNTLPCLKHQTPSDSFLAQNSRARSLPRGAPRSCLREKPLLALRPSRGRAGGS